MTDKERLETIKELVKKVKKIESVLYDEWRWQELTNLIESLYYAGHVDWLIQQAQRVQFLEMRWELLKLELEQSESLNAHFKNDEAVDTIHDIQNLMSKMESGVYYKEFHE